MGGDGSKVTASDVSAPRPRRGRPVSVGLADRRREQLTQAAFEVFVEFPYEDASVSEIASRAGVGQGTLYRYVDGKRELLDMVIDWCVDKLMEAIEPESLVAAVEAEDSTALRQVIDDLGSRLFALVDANPGLLRLLTVQGGAVDRELRYRVTGVYNTLDALIVRILTQATERGWMSLSQAEIDVIARVLPALSLPGFMLVLSGDRDEVARRAEYVAAASSLASSGLLGARKADG